MTETVECAVIGAGVVGLSVARAMARNGREVLVLEAEDRPGLGQSSRNSEVVHAGLYYPENSRKARACARGRMLLSEFCAAHSVPWREIGKLVVAADERERGELLRLRARGEANGAPDLRMLEAEDAARIEPELSCRAALFSPRTAILDSEALLRALLADAEEHGAILVRSSPVLGGACTASGTRLDVGGASAGTLLAATVVNCAGIHACRVAGSLVGFPAASIPTPRWCKGNYFALSGQAPFRHLIYPLHSGGGLGIHLTLDLAGQARFGPDVEWVEARTEPRYGVDERREREFVRAVRRYWPGLPGGALRPGYAGIRSKIAGPGDPPADFVVSGPREHGVPGVVHLFGIESPGLTACLALAEMVLRALGG
ncbi:MAG: NAD(P)/FAD-dependent oxidoreductase [Planctomycetota bacterium]